METILQSTNSKIDIGKPRLWVDRSFSKSGFGTVITGTLLDGELTVGQDVQLALSGKTSRIRGIQVHNEVVDCWKQFEMYKVLVKSEEFPHGTIPSLGMLGCKTDRCLDPWACWDLGLLEVRGP